MKVKILYLIDSTGGFEDSDDLEDFVEKDNFNYHSIESLEDIIEEEFEVTDSIDNLNFGHICWSRVVRNVGSDFDSVYWDYWIYIYNDDKWEFVK